MDGGWGWPRVRCPYFDGVGREARREGRREEGRGRREKEGC